MLAIIFCGKAFDQPFISIYIGMVQMQITAQDFQRRIGSLLVRTRVNMCHGGRSYFSACMLAAHVMKENQEGWTLNKGKLPLSVKKQ